MRQQTNIQLLILASAVLVVAENLKKSCADGITATLVRPGSFAFNPLSYAMWEIIGPVLNTKGFDTTGTCVDALSPWKREKCFYSFGSHYIEIVPVRGAMNETLANEVWQILQNACAEIRAKNDLEGAILTGIFGSIVGIPLLILAGCFVYTMIERACNERRSGDASLPKWSRSSLTAEDTGCLSSFWRRLGPASTTSVESEATINGTNGTAAERAPLVVATPRGR